MKKRRKPHINNKRFYNHEHDFSHGFLLRSFGMLFRYYLLGEGKTPEGSSCWIEPTVPSSCSVEPVITWIGHSSFLIQIAGVNILLDPIFGGLFFLYRRILPVGLSLDQMPKIDFVVLSHNHRDHMDASSLMGIKKRNKDVTLLVPQGDKAWFDKRKFPTTHEHTWWEQHAHSLQDDPSKKITFTFLPAAHWSRRGLFDRNKSLWGSWMIEFGSHRIYFAGDTCYSPHFNEIAQDYSDITTALMPIGPGEPRTGLKDWHIDAEQAGRGFLDLGAKNLIPMHWGAFPFGTERFEAPINLMQQWWLNNKTQLDGKHLHCMKVGQAISFNDHGLQLEPDR